MSYANLLLYGAVQPSYDPDRKKERKREKAEDGITFRADDPDNTAEIMAYLDKIQSS